MTRKPSQLGRSGWLALAAFAWVPAALPLAQPIDVEAAATLEQTLGALAGDGARGRLVERAPGSIEFVPDGDPLSLPVVDSGAVAEGAKGLPLRVQGSLDADGQLVLRDYRLDLAIPEDAGSGLGQELQRVVADFAATVDTTIKPVTASASVTPRIVGGGGGQTTTEALTDLYARSVVAGDAAARGAIVRSYANVRQVEKAIYGTYDNYPPWSYERIFRNASAVVAIGLPGAPQAICSGVLVGEDLVLTAGHCFRSELPEDLEVWFDYVQDPGGTRQPHRRRITELVAPPPARQAAFFNQVFDRDLYDYAIVRFAKEGEESLPRVALPSCRVEPEAPAAGSAPEVHAAWRELRTEWDARCIRRPQCLRAAHIRRGRPLYVVGYPEGSPETVHDNGRVYLPHQVTVSDFNELKLEIEADYQDDPERETILAEFVNSYVARPPRFVLEDVRYGGQPRMGIVADTFRGNSGSPVYERNEHCLVGLLIGGAEDRGERLLASWQHHESVLPVSAILDDLRKLPETEALLGDGRLDVR